MYTSAILQYDGNHVIFTNRAQAEIQLKEYFGGWRDTQAPRVLRQQTPRLSPKAFWNTIDLSETADYIEEK